MKRFLVALTVIGVALVQIDKVSAQDDTQTVNYDPYSTPTSPTYATPSTSPDSGNTTSDGGSTQTEGSSTSDGESTTGDNSDPNSTNDGENTNTVGETTDPSGDNTNNDGDNTDPTGDNNDPNGDNNDPNGDNTDQDGDDENNGTEDPPGPIDPNDPLDPIDGPFANQNITVDFDVSKILDYQIDINKYISDPGTQRYRRQSEETGKIVQRAFKNIGAKLILNFGKKVQPVFKNLVEASGNYKLTDNTSYQQCDQTCAAKCLDLNKLSMGDLEVFDRNCVNSCGCYLEYQLLNEDDQRKQRQVYRDLQTNSKRLEKFVERLAKAEKDAKWSVEDYEFELALHKDEFAQVVKDVTNDLTNCDQECINDCVDGQWVNYFEIPKCMSRCQCGQDLFKVGNADFNFPSLIQYSGRDKQAWSLFRMTQNKY